MNKSSKRLLIIDDLENDIFLTQTALEEFQIGCEVVIARNGIEGLFQLVTSHFDLVLLDIKMPFMDGFDLLKHIRKTPLLSDTPIVIVSASDVQSDRIRASSLGIIEYIYKSMNYQTFKCELKAVLANHGICESIPA